MNLKKFQGVFPLGSHLCREPMPKMSELKKDMENLKRHGFNLIKLQENWMVDEPLEGHYDFSRYEELIACAAKLDLGIYLGLTCEQAPGWLWEKHPDCRMVMRNGLPVAYQAQMTLPADGKPGPCYDHPGARADQARFITKLVQTLGRFENIVVWNTWQEIGYWAEFLAGGPVCYCENTLDFFREWLKEKYGDLDGLNRAWNARYLDWKYVTPDRVNSKYVLTPNVDWLYFMDNIQVGRVLRERCRTIKEADSLKRPVFAHRGGAVIGSGQDWTYARCQDFLGSSCYPTWGLLGHGWDDFNLECLGKKPLNRSKALRIELWEPLALRFDYIRSCNRPGSPIWAAEFQGGPIATYRDLYKGRVPDAADIRRWMLTAAGSGVSAISFWVTRAEITAAEDNGYSLLDSSGDTTKRFEEAARIGKTLNKFPGLFGKPTAQRAKLGLLVNDWNYQYTRMMEKDHLVYSLRGWHRILWEAGVSVDFVEVSQLNEDYIRQYKTFILPFPISISEKIMEKLADWVKKGGNLISETAVGRINEHAFCNRGELSPVAAELFGVKHKSITMVQEPKYGRRWTAHERTWGEYLEPVMLNGCGRLQGKSLRANVHLETFACRKSEPCLMYGQEVAGTLRKAGKGTAWLIGTYAGHNGTAYCDAKSRGLILALLEQCGVKPEHQGKLLLRKRMSGNQEAWFFTNPTEKDVTESISIKGWTKIEDLLGEKTEKTGSQIKLRVKSLDVRVLVLSK